jgi:hypothetical protein
LNFFFLVRFEAVPFSVFFSVAVYLVQ